LINVDHLNRFVSRLIFVKCLALHWRVQGSGQLLFTTTITFSGFLAIF
jgi:hypothetical protein